MHYRESVQKKEAHKISLGFWDTNRSRNPGQKTKPYDNSQKKRTCRLVGLAVPADHKENDQKNKYVDLARELKKIWNMKRIQIVIGVLRKELEDLEIERAETIQTTALLRMAWEESRRLKETYCHSNSSVRPSANIGVKNSLEIIRIIIINKKRELAKLWTLLSRLTTE